MKNLLKSRTVPCGPFTGRTVNDGPHIRTDHTDKATKWPIISQFLGGNNPIFTQNLPKIGPFRLPVRSTEKWFQVHDKGFLHNEIW